MEQTAGFTCLKSRAGFTLLEVVVAGSILAVGLSAVLTLYSGALKGVSLSRGYEEARFLAESLMAEILFERPTPPLTRTGTAKRPAGGTWQVTSEPDNALSGISRIRVSVHFTAGGKSRSMTLTTCQSEMKLPGLKQDKQGGIYAQTPILVADDSAPVEFGRLHR